MSSLLEEVSRLETCSDDIVEAVFTGEFNKSVVLAQCENLSVTDVEVYRDISIALNRESQMDRQLLQTMREDGVNIKSLLVSIAHALYIGCDTDDDDRLLCGLYSATIYCKLCSLTSTLAFRLQHLMLNIHTCSVVKAAFGSLTGTSVDVNAARANAPVDQELLKTTRACLGELCAVFSVRGFGSDRMMVATNFMNVLIQGLYFEKRENDANVMLEASQAANLCQLSVRGLNRMLTLDAQLLGAFYKNILHLLFDLKMCDLAVSLIHVFSELCNRPEARIFIFMKHILLKSPDRQPNRAKVGNTVYGFMSLLDDTSQVEFVKWSLLLSACERAAIRSNAVEFYRTCIVTLDWSILQKSVDSNGNTLLSSLIMSLNNCCRDVHSTTRSNALVALMEFTDSRSSIEIQSLSSGATRQEILQIAYSLSTDLKAKVRKVAICIISQFLSSTLDSYGVSAIEDRCIDASLMVRKQALISLTDVFHNHSGNRDVSRIWAKCLLTRLCDDEIGVREKATELIQSILLDDGMLLTPSSWFQSHSVSWNALLSIYQSSEDECFEEFCTKAIKSKLLDEKHWDSLWANITSPAEGSKQFSDAIMFMLSCMSAGLKDKVTIPVGVVEGFDDLNESEMNFLLLIASNVPPSEVDRAQLLGKLVHTLNGFHAPFSCISNYVSLIFRLDPNVACDELLRNCEAVLSYSSNGQDCHYPLRVLSCISLHVSVTSLQKIVLDMLKKDGDIGELAKADCLTCLCSMGMKDEQFAKDKFYVFLRYLHRDSNVNVRLSVMMALTDICTNYPGLVEEHLDDLLRMLSDNSLLIRLKMVFILVVLLNERYLRWSGVIFNRLCLAANDPPPMFADVVNNILTFVCHREITPRMCEFLRDGIFLFNGSSGCTNAEVPASRMKPLEKAHRREVYAYQIGRFTEPQKLLLFRTLTDILGYFIDGNMSIHRHSSTAVLSDALHILSVLEIDKAKQVAAADQLDEEDLNRTLRQDAKMRFASRYHTQNMIDGIIPVVVTLKSFLAEKRSPLMEDVHSLLIAIYDNYSDEIKQLIDSDTRLADELKFVRQLSEAKRMSSDGALVRSVSELEAAKAASAALSTESLMREIQEVFGYHPSSTPLRNRENLPDLGESPITGIRRAQRIVDTAAKNSSNNYASSSARRRDLSRNSFAEEPNNEN